MSSRSLNDFLSGLLQLPGVLARRSAERRHRKQMRRAPRFEIGSMPENEFGKLVGVIRPSRGRLLEAPLSGRLCVHYEAAIDLMTGPLLEDGRFIQTLVTEQAGIAFLLEDTAGARALVDPSHAFLSTGTDHVAEAKLGRCEDRARALVERHRRELRRLAREDHLRFREAILEIDERIAVFGGGVREPDPDAGPASYREGSATRLCLSGSARFPLLISDDERVL